MPQGPLHHPHVCPPQRGRAECAAPHVLTSRPSEVRDGGRLMLGRLNDALGRHRAALSRRRPLVQRVSPLVVGQQQDGWNLRELNCSRVDLSAV
jgi:hypothetical protein